MNRLNEENEAGLGARLQFDLAGFCPKFWPDPSRLGQRFLLYRNEKDQSYKEAEDLPSTRLLIKTPIKPPNSRPD